MSLPEKIVDIQSALRVPKGQYNSFGGFHYRSCEDILEAGKPLLKESRIMMKISDEIINLGNRFYVKATVALMDMDDGDSIVCHAYAREEENKKGMDGSQITGAASSYARKYALNGLFCLDDNKDADTQKPVDDKEDNDKGEPQEKPKESPKTLLFKEILAIAEELGESKDDVIAYVKQKYNKTGTTITVKELQELLEHYTKKAVEKEVVHA